MKNLHPYGVPYSILFENMFARTYDSSKLEEDKDRIRDAYQQKGYFAAKVLDPDHPDGGHRRTRLQDPTDQREQARQGHGHSLSRSKKGACIT